MLDIIIFGFLSSFSLIFLSGFGSLLNNNNEKDFLLNIIFGYIILSVLVTFIHFFLAITSITIIIIFSSGFLLHIKNYDYSFLNLKKINYWYVLIFFILIPIFISQKYHEDFGYYHLPYIINLLNEKIIFGLGNLNVAFIHNSIWLNILSVFNFKNNYNFVTLPTFLLYFVFITYSVSQIIKYNQNYSSNYFLIICIFYLILKFTRISEFGNDILALIFSILGIFFFLDIYHL